MQWQDVYKYLWRYLSPERQTENYLKTITPTAFVSLMQPHTKKTTAGISVHVLLPYSHPAVRAAIIEHKYYRNRYATALLAQVLSTYLQMTQSEQATIVPIPRSFLRRSIVGFDHMHLLAQKTQTMTAITYHSWLLRRFFRPPQVGKSRRQRLRNVVGSFFVLPYWLHHCRPSMPIYLIDDVVTTGATLAAAQKALTKAGFQHVIPVALADES